MLATIAVSRSAVAGSDFEGLAIDAEHPGERRGGGRLLGRGRLPTLSPSNARWGSMALLVHGWPPTLRQMSGLFLVGPAALCGVGLKELSTPVAVELSSWALGALAGVSGLSRHVLPPENEEDAELLGAGSAIGLGSARDAELLWYAPTRCFSVI